VGYRGNRYSVPPELAMAAVTVTHPVGGQFIDTTTTAGIAVAHHKLLADGLGATIRDAGHVIALDAAANTGRPHRRNQRIPPGPEARATATQLRKRLTAGYRAVIESPITTSASTVIDLSAYAQPAQLRSTLK